MSKLLKYRQSTFSRLHRLSFCTSSRNDEGKKRILIIGSNGTIGSKLAQYWMNQNKHELFLLDKDPATPVINQGLLNSELSHHHIQLNLLSDTCASTLSKLITQSDVVIPLAANNPFLDATWDEVVDSLDMINNIFVTCTNAQNLSNNKKTRIVYSSSNHALGGYLQEGDTLSKARERGYHDTASLDPKRVSLNPGTKFTLKNGYSMDSTPYAMPKVFAERFALSLCKLYPNNMESVILRIGWNQPGENVPSTLSALGSHGDSAEDQRDKIDEKANDESGFDRVEDCEQWFRHMWCSNADLYQLFDCAINHTFDENVSPKYTICNGVSNNSNSRWCIENEIGYKPQYNVNDYDKQNINIYNGKPFI
eukprot:90876_1